MGNADRIRRRREALGRSVAEVAGLAGLSHAEYLDLEAYDDELETVPSLGTVKRLAYALGVPTRELFGDDSDSAVERVSYQDLAESVRALLAGGVSQAELEEQVGWSLDQFLAGEGPALGNYPVDALKDICRRLGVNWMVALP